MVILDHSRTGDLFYNREFAITTSAQQTMHFTFFHLSSLFISRLLQLNWLFFVNITRVLFSKMFSTSSRSTSSGAATGGCSGEQRRTVTGAAPGNTCVYNYSKWFKSTLVLVPLFGVHYFFFLIFRTWTEFSHKSIIEVIWLYVDMTFSSFQVSSAILTRHPPGCIRAMSFGEHTVLKCKFNHSTLKNTFLHLTVCNPVSSCSSEIFNGSLLSSSYSVFKRCIHMRLHVHTYVTFA